VRLTGDVTRYVTKRLCINQDRASHAEIPYPIRRTTEIIATGTGGDKRVCERTVTA
jgi:hypothetical protein